MGTESYLEESNFTSVDEQSFDDFLRHESAGHGFEALDSAVPESNEPGSQSAWRARSDHQLNFYV